MRHLCRALAILQDVNVDFMLASTKPEGGGFSVIGIQIIVSVWCISICLGLESARDQIEKRLGRDRLNRLVHFVKHDDTYDASRL
jgi:hypothetical protein